MAPVRPGVPTVPLSYKLVPVQYNGTRYDMLVNLDLNSKNFLKVTEIRYGGNFASNLVAYPTDDANKKNAVPWNGPFSPVGGGGKAATALYKEVTNSQEAKQALADELSSLYGTVSPKIQKEWEKSANNAGTNNVLSNIKPGSGLFKPDPAQPPVPEVVAGNPNLDGLIELPESIKQLQNTQKATIKSLLKPGEQRLIIQYPADAYFGNTQDHVLFEQFTYRAPQEKLLSPQGGVFGGTNAANLITSGLTRNSNLRDYIGMVKLPMPNQISISNGVSWGEDRANPVEAAAFFMALPGVQNALGGNLGTLASQTFSNFTQLADQLGKGGSKEASLLLSSFISQYLLGKVGINVDPAQFIARGTGTTINPNLELLFNGPKLRSFSFAFDFAPNNETDAEGARRVMRFFRQGMAAKKVSTNTIFIGSPNVFRISYRGNNGDIIDGLNRFKICALTTCELNYTPEGVYQSYDDSNVTSMPVRTTMTLSFTELTPIFAQDYEEINPSNIDPSLADAFGPSPDVPEFTQLRYDDIGF